MTCKYVSILLATVSHLFKKTSGSSKIVLYLKQSREGDTGIEEVKEKGKIVN